MKTITLQVELSFDTNINCDEEIKEVATNVQVALVNKCLNDYITPENSEAMTTKIVVKEHFTNTELAYNLIPI